MPLFPANPTPVTNGGTGQTSFTNGQLLIGNTTGNTLTPATLTQGSNITITNGTGTITIASTGSAPTYTQQNQSSTLNPAVIGTEYSLSGSSFPITLPTAVGIGGQSMIFSHQGTNLTQVYTFNTTSAQTISGVASGSYALYTNGETITLTSDGSNWIVTNHLTSSPEVDAGALAVTSSSNYVFTLAASASITIGTIYTSNGNTFYVSATSASSTTLNCYGTGSPGASGTLVFVSGSPSGNKTFNSVVTSSPAKGSSTYEKFVWTRRGSYIYYRWDMKVGAGTAGSGDYGFFFPANLLPDTTNMQTALTVLGATTTGGIVESLVGTGFQSSSIAVPLYAYAGNSAIMKLLLQANGAYASGNAGNLANATSISLSGSYPVVGWQP